MQIAHRNNKKLIEYLVKFLSQKVAKPSIKAFIYSYLYITLPKIINHINTCIKKKDPNPFPRILQILTKAFHPFKFPMFSACLIAIINILEPVISKTLNKRVVNIRNPIKRLFVTTFLSSFVAASIAFPGFQNHILGYGRFASLDLTLLVFSRALDTALSSSLAKIIPGAVQPFGDGLLFVLSSSLIMYAWFFHPRRLPPAYRNWITSAANMDKEIVSVLSNFHHGIDIYGQESTTLDEYCKRYNKDPKRGNLKDIQPVECELVHAFQTPNCELHALWRFKRGFEFAFKLYGGLNLIMLLIPRKNVSMISRIKRALTSSIRSSCFLGAFISFYWYAVCLTRKRLLPKLFPNVPKTTWDITWAPTAGAIACGFSGFVETAQRRKELALFVFPRAIGTLIPPESSDKSLLIERIIFSISMAVLVAYCRQDPSKVRGIFGKGLSAVISVES